jgi:uncharacterized delta-60 repeat protein
LTTLVKGNNFIPKNNFIMDIKLLKTLTVIFLSITLHAQDGSLDMSFNATGASYVRAVEKLSNGKVLVAHALSTSGGLKMFNSDGTNYNFTFSSIPSQVSTSENWIQDIIEQPDGKIILLGGASTPRVNRYSSVGVLDNAFSVNVGTGANLPVRKGIVEPDGKIIIIGKFTAFNGVSKGGIVRLNADGTIDNTFLATGTTNAIGISDVIRTSNGGYYVAGGFNNFNGQSTYKGTVKLKPNGTIDSSFTAFQGADFLKIGLQSDGKLIGATGYIIKRVNVNGTEDFGFAINNINQGNGIATPAAIHVQNDNKIIFTGTVSKHNGSNVINHIFRLTANGALDSANFKIGTGPSNEIYSSQLTDDGTILIGGVFYQYNSVVRNYVARLNNASPPLYPENIATSTYEFNEKKLTTISVYPNPFEADITLNIESTRMISNVSVIDICGKKSEVSFINNKVQTTNLAEGIYTLIVTFSDNTTGYAKVIKYNN